MSLPEITASSLTRDDAINQVIVSIALEEVGLGNLINSEAEKLQYALGTLSGSTGTAATIEEVLEINRSIRDVLQEALRNQELLKNKLRDTLASAVLTGPTGPPGPTGPSQGPTGPPGPTGPTQIYGIQAKLLQKVGGELSAGETIIFDEVSTKIGTAITYNELNGEFTISQGGYYRVDWWATIDGADTLKGIVLALNVNGLVHSRAVAPPVTSQVSGSALVAAVDATPENPVILTVTNYNNYLISFEENIDVLANIVIMAIPI